MSDRQTHHGLEQQGYLCQNALAAPILTGMGPARRASDSALFHEFEWFRFSSGIEIQPLKATGSGLVNLQV
jgi:hypothetical protein